MLRVWLESCFGLSGVDQSLEPEDRPGGDLGHSWESIQIPLCALDCFEMERKAQSG